MPRGEVRWKLCQGGGSLPLAPAPSRSSNAVSGKFTKLATVTLNLIHGLWQYKIKSPPTRHFRHLLRFVVSSATPSAGSNAARNACSNWYFLTENPACDRHPELLRHIRTHLLRMWTQGLYRNSIPVFKTSRFCHLLRFVAFSATPSAGHPPLLSPATPQG